MGLKEEKAKLAKRLEEIERQEEQEESSKEKKIMIAAAKKFHAVMSKVRPLFDEINKIAKEHGAEFAITQDDNCSWGLFYGDDENDVYELFTEHTDGPPLLRVKENRTLPEYYLQTMFDNNDTSVEDIIAGKYNPDIPVEEEVEEEISDEEREVRRNTPSCLTPRCGD